MKARDCRFHVKGKYGQCWRGEDGQKARPENPNDYYNRCDGRMVACPKAEALSPGLQTLVLVPEFKRQEMPEEEKHG